jgi:hypothetical protein
MGAAQGNLAGAEIVEQGAGALYMRKVERHCLCSARSCHLSAIE